MPSGAVGEGASAAPAPHESLLQVRRWTGKREQIPMVSPWLHSSLLQEPVGNKVRCNVCERRCLLVAGGMGWCRTRQNREGRLVTLTYGAVSSLAINPVEKKPFYHFYPGSTNLTAGSWSCNFSCPWCQNWEISQVAPPESGDLVSPRHMVELAVSYQCRGMSISFNEPTLSLEWAIDVFRLARTRGLYNTFVTNGYMTPEALDMLIDAGLNGINVDIKGNAAEVRRYCKGIEVERVWGLCQQARARGLHLEITTLVVPGVNDSDTTLRTLSRRIASELGSQVPWHVTAYYPCFRFDAPPTRLGTLERAWLLGQEAGLKFVYTGNVPGHRYDNTYCPSCGVLLIRRYGFEIQRNRVTDGRCPECGSKIAGVWE